LANSRIDPSHLAPPAANYAHAILSDGPERLLHTSGVVPVAPDGTVPEAIADQARVVWDNITALLAEAGLAPADLVSVTTYVIPGQDLAVVMAERDRALAGHLAASTLVIVPELARPAWKMEIAVVAAR
jgi:enamine deaminase RidA (YjgF/YER057c/UK114 family)